VLQLYGSGVTDSEDESDIMAASFARIIDLTTALDIKLALVNTTLFRKYRSQMPMHFSELVKSKASQASVNESVFWFDFSSISLPDSYFWDGHHLNAYGAEVLSNMLADSLAANGLLPH